MDQLVVMRVADIIVDPIPGSTEGVCARCAAPVILSPSSANLLSQGPREVICNRCVDDDPTQRNMVAPGAWDELEAIQGREAVEAAKDLLARWNRKSN